MRHRGLLSLLALFVTLVITLAAGELAAGPAGTVRLRGTDSAGPWADASQQRVEVVVGTPAPYEPPEHPVECLQSDIWFLDHTPDYAGPELPPPPPDAPLLAILDTAVDTGHPALRNLLATGYDFVDEDEDPGLSPEVLDDPDRLARPGYLHATSVAGTVSRLVPGLRLAVYRVLDADCLGTYTGLARGIERAVDDGAVVILAPLGSRVLKRDVRLAVQYAEDSDVLIVAAAGNEAMQLVTQLAKRRSVMAVAAVDDDGMLAPFSSFGPHVSLSDRGNRLEVMIPKERMAAASGTSLAAARTAAVAGLVRAIAPALTAVEVKALLEDTAAPLPPEENHKLGAGVTNLEAARLAAELLADGI